MASIRAERVRLLSARSIPGGATPEPILLVSVCSAIGSADERTRFCVTFDPDGLFSRDRPSGPALLLGPDDRTVADDDVTGRCRAAVRICEGFCRCRLGIDRGNVRD